ncbi:DUF2884 family protein [Dyella sp. ASV21]|uniref:DUF2884 family protein n=1 Tax=Dyella sp. ASV21 TaxID=2795114 RepID=UPI0018ECCE7F|nr:DUF2884 family protein [Dyella sp. ASV21]
MRKTMMSSALVAGVAFGGAAQARNLEIHDGHCGYTTDYDVRVNASGIDFWRDAGKPAQVNIHDGQLRVDGRDISVSADDAARLRTYEAEVRGLLPEVAGIAREGVNIGYAAMRTVMITFAESESDRRRMVDRLDENRRQALARIDNGLGKGVWQHHDMDETIADGIGESVSDLVGKITGEAVTAALSGNQSKVAALQARAESLDKSIDREVNARSDALNRRSEALCPRLTQLDQLQQQFQFRLQDGSRLQLLIRDPNAKDNKKLATATERTRAD